MIMTNALSMNVDHKFFLNVREKSFLRIFLWQRFPKFCKSSLWSLLVVVGLLLFLASGQHKHLII